MTSTVYERKINYDDTPYLVHPSFLQLMKITESPTRVEPITIETPAHQSDTLATELQRESRKAWPLIYQAHM